MNTDVSISRCANRAHSHTQMLALASVITGHTHTDVSISRCANRAHTHTQMLALAGVLTGPAHSHAPCLDSGLTELGLECRRSLGDSFPLEELLELRQGWFPEWTLFPWLAALSTGSRPLGVRWPFLSSGMVAGA